MPRTRRAVDAARTLLRPDTAAGEPDPSADVAALAAAVARLTDLQTEVLLGVHPRRHRGLDKIL